MIDRYVTGLAGWTPHAMHSSGPGILEAAGCTYHQWALEAAGPERRITSMASLSWAIAFSVSCCRLLGLLPHRSGCKSIARCLHGRLLCQGCAFCDAQSSDSL